MRETTRQLTMTLMFALFLAASGCGDDRPPLGDSGGDAGPTDSSLDTGPLDTGPPDTGPPDTGPPDTGPDVGYVDVTLYTPSTLPDDELAAAAFTVLAGVDEDSLSCTTCHGLTLERLQDWGTTTTAALDCIGALDPNFHDQVDSILACFAGPMRDPDPEVLSLLTTAVSLEWFTRLLDVEYFDAVDMTEADSFRRRFQMPRRPVSLLEQPDVDLVLSWAARGMPLVDEQVTGGGMRCVPTISADVAAHVAAMETEGWAVLNRDRGLAMYGCEAGQVGVDCLSLLPLSTEVAYGDGWAIDGDLRILFETDYTSSFWTRSSADGRFIGQGGGSVRNSSVIDLERGVVIPIDALYDPGFFPDNSGFVFQGVGSGGGGFCNQTLLETATDITFGETGCSVFGAVGLYQHLGAVDGGDYWTIFGQFLSDDGGHDVTGPLGVSFTIGSRMSFVPIINEGDTYRPRTAVRVTTPFQGDAVISPSSRLTVARSRGTDGTQSGFVLREVIATPDATSYIVDAPVIASYCERGSKPGFSFDERYMVLHRYIADTDAVELGFTGPDDPGFAGYASRGGANLFLMDLVTGDQRRITNMRPGQYALFPHFRSDGWIYFIVRDIERTAAGEYMVAANAALVPAP